MATVIGIRFKKAGKVYYFSPGEVWPRPGENVIVETTRGIELGEVVTGAREVSDEALVLPLKSVLRRATDSDLELAERNVRREKDAFELCVKKIAAHKLEMKLVDVEYTFDDTKIIFYFTANGRVDFRDLVKDLASVFHMRIELRQIGVRDEAKMLGGLGACGRKICCDAFLSDFQPVSIKMAKEQNISLNPTKISGQCGRLMCCLKYEQDYYEETLKRLPRVGKEIMTPDGIGYVTEISVLKEKVKVRIRTGDDDFEVREYGVEDVRKLLPGEKIAENELPPKPAEKPQPQTEAEEENPDDAKKKRYPRPKAVKTMNTEQYMALHATKAEAEDENSDKKAAPEEEDAAVREQAQTENTQPDAPQAEAAPKQPNNNRHNRNHDRRGHGGHGKKEAPEAPKPNGPAGE